MSSIIWLQTNFLFVKMKMRDDLKRLNESTGKATATTAEFGKNLMYRIAPKKTGATARAIKWTKGKHGGKTATIIVGDGHPERMGQIQKDSDGQGYGLTYYMNFGAKGTALRHWNTGEPKFIEKGKDLINKNFRRNVRVAVNAFVKPKMVNK